MNAHHTRTLQLYDNHAIIYLCGLESSPSSGSASLCRCRY
jgi:hypothetical protein